MKKYSVSVLVTVLLLFQQTGYSDKPTRIVSLDLCTDWMLLKYASQSQVLAYSSLLYRYQADWVDDGLSVHNGSLEQIIQLQPDLVITGEYNAITLRQRLKQLGYKVRVLPLPDSLDDIQEYERQFLALVQAEKPVANASIQTSFEKKNKTLLLLGANGIGTGKGTLEDNVLIAAGWDNYLQKSGYINLPLEQIAANPPHSIYWSAPVSNSLANLYSEHSVVKRIMPQEKSINDENWRWQCPGPWTFELIRELSQWQSS